MISLTIIGNNSAVPAFGRNPTAQILQCEGKAFLIDCGEGTQWQLSRHGIKKSKISHIFISHLHGDHYFGLPGLLTSLGLLNHNKDIHLFGPPLLESLLELQFKASSTTLPYTLHFHALEEDGPIANTEHFIASCFKVKHGIDCWGFRFDQKKKARSVIAERAHAYGIPFSFFPQLQDGMDYKHPKGTIIPNEEVTSPASAPVSYAYSADTVFEPSLAEKFKGVDLLYHETTYLKNQEEKAKQRMHSTSEQAASIAKLANVKKLIIGHFSSKYEDLAPFLEEARAVFTNTDLATEGTTFRLNQD
jgi:ribonuclease Z